MILLPTQWQTQYPTITGECSQCGEYTSVSWDCDPYMAEIWTDRENPYNWWCRNCTLQSMMDI